MIRCLCPTYVQSESYITTDSQSVLVSDTHLRPATNFSSPFLIIIIPLRVCWCRTPSLTRGRVYSLQLLLGLASVVFLGPESLRTHDHIFSVSDLRLPQPRGPGSCIYFPQESNSAVILPGVGFHFCPSEVMLQLTVSRPVCPGVGPSVASHDQIFNFLFFNLTIAWFLKYGALSDERTGL
jgi:hypothetical protein